MEERELVVRGVGLHQEGPAQAIVEGHAASGSERISAIKLIILVAAGSVVQFAGLPVAVQRAPKEHIGDTISGRRTGRGRSPRAIAAVRARCSLSACGARTPKGRRLVEVAVVCLILNVMGDQRTELQLMLACHLAVVVGPSAPVHPVGPGSCVPKGAVTPGSPEDGWREILSRSFTR